MKKRILIIVIAVITVFILFVPVFTFTAKDGGSKIRVPLVPWMYYIDYHENHLTSSFIIQHHTVNPVPYAEKTEEPEYIGGHGVGLFFGLIDISFDKYAVYEDGYKGKIKGLFEMTPKAPENKKILKDALEAFDSKDREKAVKKFSLAAKEAPGFDQELDEFLKAYPGDLSKIQLDDGFVEWLESEHGRRLADGKYALECYNSWAGTVNGRWYYIFISYLFYCASGEEYTGINKILILDETSRAVSISNDTAKPFEHALCDIDQTGIEYRRIGGDYYVWKANRETPWKVLEVINALRPCKNYDDVVKALGKPNASVKGDKTGRYFYEGIAEDGKPRYYCITVTDYDNRDRSWISCSIWDTDNRSGATLFDSNKEHREYPAELKIPFEDTFTLKLNDDYSITRDDHEGFEMLCWNIYRNGEHVLTRIALGELSLDPDLQWLKGKTGTFTIYLTAVIDGGYKTVSNTIVYTLEEPAQTESGDGICMTVDGREVPVIWENNASVMALKKLAKNGMTFRITAYGETKHGATIGKVITSRDDTIKVSAGDIVLHSSNELIICSGQSSGLYTRIGKIDLSEDEIQKLFTNKEVEIVIKRG